MKRENKIKSTINDLDNRYDWRAKVEYNLGNTMASLPQLWDWLKKRESKDNEVSRRMWKVVETEVGKIRVGKTKRRRGEKRKEKEARKERVKNKIK